MTTEDPTRCPGDFIREELDARGWTQKDLADILGRPLPTVNRILKGKHGIMPEMAVGLAEVFGTTAELWLDRESRYRLSLVDGSNEAVRHRRKLYELVPLRDLQRRGWIDADSPIDVSEQAVLELLQIAEVDEEPKLHAATRKSTVVPADLSRAQRAWCFRVLQLTAGQSVSKFSIRRVDACQNALRTLAAQPEDVAKVPQLLADYGIRFAVVEHLTGTRIDGAALWLNSQQPVIGMSMRHDRIDYFWFTLLHELSHIRHRDALSVNAEHTAKGPASRLPEFEQRADAEATAALVQPDRLAAAIPEMKEANYSFESVEAFADSEGVHPGIVVGQLHYKRIIGYDRHRSALVKVRDCITSTATTDGWQD